MVVATVSLVVAVVVVGTVPQAQYWHTQDRVEVKTEVASHTQYSHAQDCADEVLVQAIITTSPTRKVRRLVIMSRKAVDCEHNLGLCPDFIDSMSHECTLCSVRVVKNKQPLENKTVFKTKL